MLIPEAFQPDRHQIIHSEPPFMEFLRRRFPEYAPCLFLYYSPSTGNFVVAGWLRPNDRRKLVSLQVVGKSPVYSRRLKTDLEFILEPPPGMESNPDRMARQLKTSENQRVRDEQDLRGEVRDMKKSLYHKACTAGWGHHRWFNDVR